MAVKEIKQDEFDKLVIDSKENVLVDCFATWCGPCKMIAPIIEEISEENKDFKYYKLDVDDAEEISMKYGIMSIPTLLIFKNGELVNKSVGLISKTQISDLLK